MLLDQTTPQQLQWERRETQARRSCLLKMRVRGSRGRSLSPRAPPSRYRLLTVDSAEFLATFFAQRKDEAIFSAWIRMLKGKKMDDRLVAIGSSRVFAFTSKHKVRSGLSPFSRWVLQCACSFWLIPYCWGLVCPARGRRRWRSPLSLQHRRGICTDVTKSLSARRTSSRSPELRARLTLRSQSAWTVALG